MGVVAYPDDSVRSEIANHPDEWSLVKAASHHLSDLAGVVNDVVDQGPINLRLDAVEAQLAVAHTGLHTLSQQGVPFSGAYSQRLETFRRALESFRTLESV